MIEGEDMELDIIFQMTQLEKAYKEIYEKDGHALLEQPMTYEQYLQLDEDKKILYREMEKHRSTVFNNMYENTVADIDTKPDLGYVEIVQHSRYSYPILHNHEYIELVYVYSGSCMHFVENQSFEMKRGDLCILAPNAMHAISAYEDDAVLVNIMMSQKLFDASFLKMMQRGTVLPEFFESVLYERKVSPYIIYPTGNDEWMHEIVLHMVKERRKKDYLYNESVSLMVRQMFIHILRNYELMAIVSDPICHMQENRIVALMGYISVNYRSITLAQTADFFGYSRAYMSQILSNYTGKTFTALVNEEKMKNAAKLLRETRLSLTEIGVEVGCYDASHFTHKFKKIYGMTPTEYRMKETHKNNF